ncbi:ABC transporter ATP-binding protein [Longimycelium tulufanense]|uniref:ABC transporter ATP-binding protein n=1 Tax=Longimycelium tulufanense TaxID=907463 RepID=A0A8J3C954_9PSEU|nr:ABC transporter ATP-binding protein [Longimycelium tulufanense]GGM37550.1 ABC transporter ATP-binding protein [Longimycelium tulufanense]
MTGELLDVRGLSVRFLLGRRGRGGEVRAVTDATFSLRRGQLLALVGESGCGKSVLASALLGLLPGNAQVRGHALLSEQDGPIDVMSAPENVLAQRVRGRLVGLVPQSAATHLTPVRTARSQLLETVRVLRPDVDDPFGFAEHLAERVGLEPAFLDRYPHELSGGMAQRVAVALALVGDPPLVVADEPTTGLDRPLVRRTVDLLAGLAEEGRAVLMITHDLAAARPVATDLAVMYASRLVELGPAARVFAEPLHPYTAGLLAALPGGGFTPIPGEPPELTALPAGCAFAPRCPLGPDAGCSGDPELIRWDDRMVACRRPC